MKTKKPDVEVRDDVPVPENIQRGRRFRFPLDRLEVGQCMIVRGHRGFPISPYINYAEKALGRKFKTQTREDGIYVWRVA